MPWMLSRAPVGLCCWPTYSSSCLALWCCCWARRPILHLALLVAGCSWPPDWCAACIDDCSTGPTHACYSPTSWWKPWWAIAPWWRSSQRRSNRRARTEVWQSTVASRPPSTARWRACRRFLPRGWLVAGCGGARPELCNRTAQSTPLAVSLGGVLLVYLALRRVAMETGPGLAAAFLGWRRTQPLFEAASETPEAGESVAVLPTEVDEASAGRRGLLVGRDVSFSYPGRLEPVLRGCSIEIRRHQHILLEGPSGSGKSTLGALLCGLRQPSSGLLLLGGFDHHSLRPERWRQRAAGVRRATRTTSCQRRCCSTSPWPGAGRRARKTSRRSRLSVASWGCPT